MSFSMPARNLLEFDMTIGEYILDVWYYIFNVDMGSWNTIRHSNSDYEIHVIISGSCSFEREKKKETVHFCIVSLSFHPKNVSSNLLLYGLSCSLNKAILPHP